jgi:hypothetical protein
MHSSPSGCGVVTSASLLEGLRLLVADLRAEQRRFALVGGIAVAVRGEPRFTRDVDVCVAATDDRDLESLVFALRARGYEVAALVEQEATGRLATARLLSSSGLITDLLGASCGIEAEVVERAGLVDIAGAGAVPVARPEELLAMKVLSMTDSRPQDRMDAVGLLKLNPDLDLRAVRGNLRLIDARGFSRGRDLEQLLGELLGPAGGAPSIG